MWAADLARCQVENKQSKTKESTSLSLFLISFLALPPTFAAAQRVGGWQARQVHKVPLSLLRWLVAEREAVGGGSSTSPQPTVASYTETLHVSRSCCLGTTSSGHTTHAQPPPPENQPGNNLGRFPQRHNQNLSDNDKPYHCWVANCNFSWLNTDLHCEPEFSISHFSGLENSLLSTVPSSQGVIVALSGIFWKAINLMYVVWPTYLKSRCLVNV